MTEAEIIEILEEQGIDYDPNALKADLEALLPKPEEVEEVVEDEVVEDQEEVEEVEEEAPVATGKVAIVSYLGRTREYSQEIHGKDYKKLAEQFANQYEGATVELA